MIKGLVPTPNGRLCKTARHSVAGCGRYGAGFTLIEVLVVISITVIITGLLIANFSRTRMDLNQATLTVKAAIREAQSMALSGTLFVVTGPTGSQSTSRCGYGIHFTANGYAIYAGPVSDQNVCAFQNYNYAPDNIVRQGVLSNSVLEIVVPVPDIFFEPPDPKTYIIGSGATNQTAIITIRRKGTEGSTGCNPADCRQINVTNSGQIQ